jgi:cell surface protein SprA
MLGGIIIYSTYAAVLSELTVNAELQQDQVPVGSDVTQNTEQDVELRFPLNKQESVTYEDLHYQSPADLRDPANVNSSVEYDPNSGLYIFRTKVGDMDIVTPFVLNEEEYRNYSLRQSMSSYWADKNKGNVDAGSQLSLSNIQIGLNPTADKIFGPGGVQLKTQGSVDLSFGFKISSRNNPTIPERNRRNTIFDFDTKIQLSANAKVGDRVNFNMNYNTEATFDFDQKLLKLSYDGKEDDIIKKVEAGNVSLPLSSSLITGSTALFGFRTDLQFGKLKVSAIASQQESERKTISTQGAQTTDFRISASDYDENRHYFLSSYFYENYDNWAKRIPDPQSGIVINRVEVWVTNRSSYDKQSRNIIGFTDLGEQDGSNPYNRVDPLYEELLKVPAIRNFQTATDALNNFVYRPMEIGQDFENLNSARLLQASEYTVNKQMGYISLRSTLSADDVLAVAYEYTKDGKVYQVGEFSTDQITTESSGTVRNSPTLYVKLLKSTTSSPQNKRLWNLYMKNIYSLGAYNIQADQFRLDVMYYYQDDTVSAYLPYIPAVNKTILLRILNLDRLNKRMQAAPDGYFDFVEGYTVYSSNGRIIFLSTRPFDKGILDGYNGNLQAQRFAYPELYDSTKTVAKQFTEKDKYVLSGEYRSSSGSEIRLGATNVPRGSVRVTAGGRTLVENEGFTVDYNMGIVRIIDEVALASNSPVSVTLESQSFFSMQRKSLVGTNLEYAFSDKFSLGGTLLHLSEKPLTQKVGIGNEPLSNTIWGLNGSYKTDWQWLTNMVDKIPLINATAPSSIAFSGEVAQLIPGHSSAIDQNDYGVSYIDDFEGTKSSINILHPSGWSLSSTPKISGGRFVGKKFIRDDGDPGFWGNYLSGENLTNIGYGLNRALIAWFYIDQIFTRPDRNTPSHIRNDNNQLSNHYVREVKEQEIFQNKEALYGQSTTMQTLSLNYYPRERGPYNLDVSRMGIDGYLENPENRWAGIMRKIDNSDFEKSNIEYLEFWLMDPFVYSDMNTTSGQLVFNLGDVSEDVLKDGRISFENGLPTANNPAGTDTTVWGRAPRIQAITNSFDVNSITMQDVGLDGLSSADEMLFDLSYKKYYDGINAKITEEARQRYNNAIFSPLNDPAGDDFHHYRGSDYDSKEVSILERYKYYNGLEGNSSTTSDNYTTASTTYPNTEDINNDRTLNEKEQYYEYVVEIDREMFENSGYWEANYITNMVESRVTLKNGNTEPIKWYQFRIPIKTANKRVEGSISDFRSIRFIRMYLTGFEDETHLRFGAMEFVRTEWRVYEKNENLVEETGLVTGKGKIEISAVNIENDANKQPVPYVLPPGISRVIDPSQTQLRQENEQSMVIRIDSLESKDARAVYKLGNIDMRRYERFKMFVHAEKRLDGEQIPNNRMYIFVRLGSDFTQNYYEYQIPLTITPDGAFDPYEIWPSSNAFDFPFETLTDLKLKRDKKKAAGLVRFNERYSEMEGRNLITVIGNPSIGEVTSLMIGVRNEDNVSHSVEIWINEMRMAGFNEEGGWAALGNLGIVFSDLGSLNLGGRVETVGFGGIEQNVADRRLEDYYEYNMSTAIQLGKFFPEKARVNLPVTYTYSKQISKPEYDPLNTDIKLDESLDNQDTKAQKDSVRSQSITETTYKSLTLSNVRVGIVSETPMPYDPANFSFSLGYNETYDVNPETEYLKKQTYRGTFNYVYSINPKPVEPFKRMKAFSSDYLKIIRDFNFYYLPTQIAFSTTMNRYYSEMQMRNFSMPLERDTTFPFMTYDQDWTWDRTSDIKFNLSKGLKLSFSSAMNSLISEIIETDNGYRSIPVNKQYLREVGAEDWYELWRDTVWASIKQFGKPITYQQRFTSSYALPINKLPFMDWITSSAQYSADYIWNKGAELELGKPSPVGNIATNTRLWNGDIRFNFENLYNKSNYLKEINRKYSSRGNTNNRNNQAADQPKVYERKNIRLRKDNKMRIAHRLNSTNLHVVVTDGDGNIFPVKYSVTDPNTITLDPKEDGANMNITVTSIVKDRTILNDILDVSARVLMMVRNVSATYRHGDALTLQGYMPGSGFLGQDNAYSAPGYAFTFGFFNTDNFLEKSYANRWLDTMSMNMVNPVIRTQTQDFQIKTLIEPIPGLKVDVNAGWMKNYNTEIYYMYSGREVFSGSYSKTHIALKTAFRKPEINSGTFAEFLSNRSQIASRLIRENNIPDGHTFNMNSADVMIPAFFAAYSGRDAGTVSTDILQGIFSMLPNWRVSYDGLSRLDFIKKYFKSVNINHAYRSTYNIGSFSSIANWESGLGDYGYIPETNLVSSPYYIESVNINEAFSPLIGMDASLHNSLLFKLEFRRSRNAQLDIPGNQIVESYSNEYVIGSGYRIDDFGMIIRLNNNQQKKIKNDLNIRVDISYKVTDAFIRKIDEAFSQLSNGLNSFVIKISADYVFSEKLNIRLFYDRTATTPKVSQGYPTTNTNFGIGFRFLLTQ